MAQPDTVWTKTFGGANDDFGVSVQQTSDGGFIIAGETRYGGTVRGDIWLIKTDEFGDMLWTKTYGGSSRISRLHKDRTISVQETSDGGYILMAFTDARGSGGDDFWLIKTDTRGDTLWTKTYGGNAGDRGKTVLQTSDGGYVLMGFTFSYGVGSYDVWLIKTDVLGDTVWTKTIGREGHDICFSTQKTSDNGYIMAGHTNSYGAGSFDSWLVKTDARGDTLWTKTYGRSYGDFGDYAQQTLDGGYILTGAITPYSGASWDVWLIKTDAWGDTLWTKIYGGNSLDYARCVQQTSDRGYILTGHTSSYGAGGYDIWVIKTDVLGDTVWTKTIGGRDMDYGRIVQQTSDGGYIIVGYTYSYGAGGSDVWLIRIAPDKGMDTVKDRPILFPSSSFLHQNHPNPFNPVTTLRYDLPERADVVLTIHDILGRQIKTLIQGIEEPGHKSVVWDAKDDFGRPVSTGIYLYRITAGYFTQTRKMVLLR